MALIADLVTKLTVDSTKFRSDMKKAINAGKAGADSLNKNWKKFHKTIADNKAFRFMSRNISGVITRMRQLGRVTQRTIALTSRFIRDFGTLSRFFLLGAGLGGAGIFGAFKLVNNLTEQARDIRVWADVLGMSTERLQEFQIAGASVGLTATKMSDILKDVSDKLGDFAVTGGGEASKILKELNIDFEALRGAAPDDAIKSLVNSIQSLSKQEQIFVMEALANDASRLLPLLRENGKEFDKLIDKAKQSGRIMSDQDLKALQKYEEAVRNLQNIWTALKTRIGVELSDNLTRFIDRIREMIEEMDIKAVAKTAANMMLGAIRGFVSVAAMIVKSVLTAAKIIAEAVETIRSFAPKNMFSPVKRALNAHSSDRLRSQAGVDAVDAQSSKLGDALNKAGEKFEWLIGKIDDLGEAAAELTKDPLKSSLPTLFGKIVTTGDLVDGALKGFRTTIEAADKASKEFKEGLGIAVKELNHQIGSELAGILKKFGKPEGESEDIQERIARLFNKLPKPGERQLSSLEAQGYQSDIYAIQKRIGDFGEWGGEGNYKSFQRRSLPTESAALADVQKRLDVLKKPQIDQKFEIKVTIAPSKEFDAKVEEEIRQATNNPQFQARLTTAVMDKIGKAENLNAQRVGK